MPCSPRMAACKITCLHYQHVETYRLERLSQEQQMEEVAKGYTTEEARYPIITFRQYLIDTKGWNRHE